MYEKYVMEIVTNEWLLKANAEINTGVLCLSFYAKL